MYISFCAYVILFHIVLPYICFHIAKLYTNFLLLTTCLQFTPIIHIFRGGGSLDYFGELFANKIGGRGQTFDEVSDLDGQLFKYDENHVFRRCTYSYWSPE